MLNVNAATKSAYLGDSTHKIIRVVFPDLNLEYTNDELVSQSLELKESLCEGDIEFVGCIASEFKITIRNLTDDVKGTKVNVYISTRNTEEIPLFNGYVYEVELAAEKRHKKIKAYDVLYTLSQTDVASWYTGLSFPITLKNLRDSLFSELGVIQETATLPNDNVQIVRRYSPTTLRALDVIKSLCQINGVFGKINRYERFEYVTPSSGGSQVIPYYKTAKYQEFTVKPADKVVVVFGDTEGVYGGGTNSYTVQNNMFANGLDETTLQSIAQNIYNNVYQFSYRPITCDVNGLPYLECLDKVTMDVADIESSDVRTMTFTVLSRNIKGIQSLRDKYIAEGDEYQHKFVTDVSVEIEQLKKIVEYIQNDMDNLKFKYFLISNNEDILVGDSETKTLIDNLKFEVARQTVAVFHAEILLDVDTTVDNVNDEYNDGVGEFTYIYNYNVLSDYKPVETWTDGKHIVHLLKYFEIEEGGINTLSLTLNMDGASALVKAGHFRASLYGQNIVASSEWDGLIQVKDRPSDITLIDNNFDTANENVSIGTIIPTPATASDVVSNIALYDVIFDSATDDVTIEARTDSLPFVTENGDSYVTEDGTYTLYSEGE